MPTTVVKKIGASNSPVVMDYSTIQSWEDAAPVDLTAVDQIYRGECYNQGTLSTFNINGETTDTTRYMELTTAAGQSFRDNPSIRTTPLFPSSSNGVYLFASLNYSVPYAPYANFTRVSFLQIVQGGVAAAVATNLGATLNSCIIQAAATVGGNENGQGTWINCLLIAGTVYGTSTIGITIGNLFNCTLVIPAGSTSTQVGLKGSNYAATRNHINCAVFGFTGLTGGVNGGSSDYAATDSTTALEGAHTISGLTYASQFVNSANDFRAVATGGLKAGGGGVTSVDISGQTRDTTTPYIGCWEVAGSAPTTTETVQMVIIT